MKQTLYMNLYRTGVFHRQGKPHAANFHGGDLYASEAIAMELAEPENGYITTISVVVDFAAPVLINAPDSVPMPLSATRRGVSLAPYLVLDQAPSLETAESNTPVSYEDWRANRSASGFLPLPAAHGGYLEAAMVGMDPMHMRARANAGY